MELKVGMYVRTNEGRIHKIEEVLGNKYYVGLSNNVIDVYGQRLITKVSYNVIDLIEVGDILTINQFNNDLEKVEVYETFNIYTKARELCVLSNGKPKRVIEVNIKSVLTHELYEKNCYKVVE